MNVRVLGPDEVREKLRAARAWLSVGSVGLLGGGVIGAGWAARFLLNGVDVRLYDPVPRRRATVDEVLDERAARIRRGSRSRRCRPRERSTLVATRSRRQSTGVELVQECAPERLELKRELLAAADRAAPAGRRHLLVDVRACARPSCRRGMARPERLVVGHPFNPVYLLPLVELCGGERTAPRRSSARPASTGRVGMQPLVVRTEIDGFVADRLLEALWREALWLVARRRRDRRGDRRRDPLRRRAALGVHGHVPHLPDRRRRGRHAALHGAVRAGAAVAVDEARPTCPS